MAELFEAVASWQTLLLVLLVFGFAPGFVLRLLVLAYPRRDPRRRELIAELYGVPRVQRPLWVAEQMEVALFEGVAHRASAAIRSLIRQRRARAQAGQRGMTVGSWVKVAVAVGVGVWAWVAGAPAGAAGVATVYVAVYLSSDRKYLLGIKWARRRRSEVRARTRFRS